MHDGLGRGLQRFRRAPTARTPYSVAMPMVHVRDVCVAVLPLLVRVLVSVPAYDGISGMTVFVMPVVMAMQMCMSRRRVHMRVLVPISVE